MKVDEFDYELPAGLIAKLWNGRYRGQQQRWFALRCLEAIEAGARDGRPINAAQAVVTLQRGHRRMPWQDDLRRALELLTRTSVMQPHRVDGAAAIAAYTPHRRRAPNPEGLKKVLRLRDDGRWHWHWDPAFLDTRTGGSRKRHGSGRQTELD